MISFFTNPRKIILLFIDIILSFAAIFFAHLLRWDGNIPEYYTDQHLKLLFPFLAIRSVVFIGFKFYSKFWEYSTLEDLIEIIKAVILGSFLVVFFVFLYDRSLEISRSVMIIDMVLLITMLGGSKLSWRLWREQKRLHLAQGEPNKKYALILGAGDTGAQLLTYIRRFAPNYSIKGFIDDDPKKLKSSLMGIKVLGNRNDISELSKSHGVKEVLIAVRNISSETLNQIVTICDQSGIKYKMISSVLDLSTNEIHISKLKNIETNDLLGRELVSLDLTSIKKMIQGKRVLVTGAGGSIGSQLCAHILEHSPEALIMLDRGENYLYDLQMFLSDEVAETQTHYYFGSVTNTKKMESIFSKHRPHLIFHAAAHKHVPLMEENIDEAIINNIQGTQVAAEMAEKFGAEKFVLVSTDKVVQPTSIMGMTKKVAETLIQLMAQKNKTQFMIVRFGNVLGSNGSIVPLLQKQIERGGPVTITDPEMERFFMLIPEAVQLILQAGALGCGGDIFILEMGKPVKIIDLAKKMIELAGYSPGGEMEIKFIGTRPGEKLREELIDHGERTLPTIHEKIKLLRPNEPLDDEFLMRINRLCRGATNLEPQKLRQALFELATAVYPKAEKKQNPQNFQKPKISN
jgi:FlaA1/EpsC-like NDP-sugar epimerase